MWGQSLTELFLRGGPVMWPLLLCSVIGLAIVIERSLAFLLLRVDFDALVARLRVEFERGTVHELRREVGQTDKPLPRVAAAYLDHLHSPAAVREAVVSREGSQQLARLERRLNWLAVVTRISPLLGLLGTVAGLVTAFHQIELKGGQVQPGDLASGIWAALLTTVFGLTIALPCLAAHHYFEHRTGAVALQMQWITSYLDEWFNKRTEFSPSAEAGAPDQLEDAAELSVARE